MRVIIGESLQPSTSWATSTGAVISNAQHSARIVFMRQILTCTDVDALGADGFEQLRRVDVRGRRNDRAIRKLAGGNRIRREDRRKHGDHVAFLARKSLRAITQRRRDLEPYDAARAAELPRNLHRPDTVPR